MALQELLYLQSEAKRTLQQAAKSWAKHFAGGGTHPRSILVWVFTRWCRLDDHINPPELTYGNCVFNSSLSPA